MTEKTRKYTNAFGNGWNLGKEAAKNDIGPVRKIPRPNGYDQEKLYWEHGYIRGYIAALESIDEKLVNGIKEKRTVQDVVNSMSKEQKKVLGFLVGKAAGKESDDKEIKDL